MREVLHRRRTRVVTGAVVLAVLGGGSAAWATASGGVSGYQTGVATTASVDSTLSVSGTAASVDQATASFQTAGTVSAVDVTVGQTVTAGGTIATLDTTTLEADVSAAELSLKEAQATLTENEDDESTSTASTAAVTTSSSAPNAVELDAAVTPTPSTTGTLKSDQAAVVAAQQAVDADAQTAAADLATADTACAATAKTTTTTTTAKTSKTTKTVTTTKTSKTTTSTTTTTTTTAKSDAPKSTTTGPTSATCSADLAVALAAQQAETTALATLSAAESALATLLSTSSADSQSSAAAGTAGSASSATSTTSPSTTTSTSSPTATSGKTSQGGTSSKSTTTTVTASQIASDQSAIDADEAALVDAQENLADATLISPISGTVVSVGLTVGASVTAGSSTDAVKIINAGSYQVSGSLTSTESAEVKVGDKAMVSIDGLSSTIDGVVTRVGPVDSSDTEFTYPLVVTLPTGSHGIADGASAEMDVVTDEAKDILAVPTSAVTTTSSKDSYVDVLVAGAELRKKVTVGIVGTDDTQILSGIKKGAVIVLADLSTAVPTSSTDTETNFSAGGTGDGGGTGGGPSGGSPPSFSGTGGGH